MAARAEEIGLQPLHGKRFHEFKANTTMEGPVANFVIEGGDGPERQCGYLSDYVTLIYSGRGAVECDVVFVGYGIHAPDEDRDDYAGIDVDGKIVMAVRGKPEGAGFDEERYIGYKTSSAFDRGARGFILVEGDNAVPGTIQEKYYRGGLPAVWASRGAADDLLKRAGKEDLAAQVAALGRGEIRSFPLEGVKVKLEINSTLLRDRRMRNVLGLWPGETDEYVVVGAHLDHVGMDAAGNVYNGADDNASGSAMLLEVARAVVAGGKRFRRNILFCWFAGEEQGLLGSWAFVKDPPVPLEKIAIMFNSDMVGQGKPRMRVGGIEVYPLDANRHLGGFDFQDFDWKPFRAAPNSDHWPFQSYGVPAFFVNTEGPHPNYHRPEDDWPNMKPELLELAGRYVKLLAELAAGLDQPFCRPQRLAEYAWYFSPVVDLYSNQVVEPVHGIDLRVQWFDGDFVAIDRELARTELEEAPENCLLAGGSSEKLVEDLRPTVILGLKGRSVARLHAPARRMGVLVFAPYLDNDAPVTTQELMSLNQLHAKRPFILAMRGAPPDFDYDLVEAPMLLSPEQARKGAKGLVTVAITAGAEAILALRKEFGANRLLVTAGDDPRDPAWKTVVDGLLMAKLDIAQVKQLLGGNFLRLVDSTRRK